MKASPPRIFGREMLELDGSGRHWGLRFGSLMLELRHDPEAPLPWQCESGAFWRFYSTRHSAQRALEARAVATMDALRKASAQASCRAKKGRVVTP